MGKTRVGDERAIEDHQIGVAVVQGPVGFIEIIMAADDDRAQEPCPDRLAKRYSELRRVIPIGLNQVEIPHALRLQEVSGREIGWQNVRASHPTRRQKLRQLDGNGCRTVWQARWRSGKAGGQTILPCKGL
jgi:hypothetical protein